jgi:hypothetical protein
VDAEARENGVKAATGDSEVREEDASPGGGSGIDSRIFSGG